MTHSTLSAHNHNEEVFTFSTAEDLATWLKTVSGVWYVQEFIDPAVSRTLTSRYEVCRTHRGNFNGKNARPVYGSHKSEVGVSRSGTNQRLLLREYVRVQDLLIRKALARRKLLRIDKESHILYEDYKTPKADRSHATEEHRIRRREARARASERHFIQALCTLGERGFTVLIGECLAIVPYTEEQLRVWWERGGLLARTEFSLSLKHKTRWMHR